MSKENKDYQPKATRFVAIAVALFIIVFAVGSKFLNTEHIQSAVSNNEYFPKIGILIMLVLILFSTRIAFHWLKVIVLDLAGISLDDLEIPEGFDKQIEVKDGKKEKRIPMLSVKLFFFLQKESDSSKWVLPLFLYALCFIPIYLSIIQFVLVNFTTVKVPSININFTAISIAVCIFGGILGRLFQNYKPKTKSKRKKKR